ncbi:MAG: hypothetical protein CM15mP68_3110 [Pseudomonadota bacterium]|nr:MAG: hypothetical protein CM15mP68_3110 [Pseudomonadota bacterium]
MLITDHNVKETLDICDRAYIVHEGHLIAAGKPELFFKMRPCEKFIWATTSLCRPASVYTLEAVPS